MLIIFDKDDTLVQNPAAGRPANTLDEQVLFPDVLDKCRQLRAEGHTLAIASNQGGVAFGHFDHRAAVLLVKSVAEAIEADLYAVCVTHPRGTVKRAKRDSRFRKPNPGMLHYLMDALGFAPDETVYVGDMESDRQAAEAAGVRFAWAWEFFGRQHGVSADRLPET